MARSRKEVALQTEVETQEEWEETLAKEGLTVIDVYQEWCGPCKAMTSIFRRLKLELGDDLLRFAIAKADTVDALEDYCGSCKPCFLFYAGGSLVAVVRTANSPLLLRTITEQLAYEHKVLDGTATRKEIVDPMLASKPTSKEVDEDDEEDEDVQMKVTTERRKDVSFGIIKPDVVAEGKQEDIIDELKSRGIDILSQEERTLTEEEARKFYSHKEHEDFFEDLVQFMTSGPCILLIMSKGDTGEGVVDDFHDLLGPPNVEVAKEQAPDSMRAKYGKESFMNGLHGADSKEAAMRELAFFYPDYEPPTYTVSSDQSSPVKKPMVKTEQRTLALIRPDALREKKDEILAKIKEAGFQIALLKEIQLTRAQAEEFYKDQRDENYFEDLIDHMTSGPVMALALVRDEAVQTWRDLLGPKEVEKAKTEHPDSLRAQFSQDNAKFNQLHGADSEENALQELEFFFPSKTVAVIKPDAIAHKDEIIQRIREAGFHIVASREDHMTRELAEEFYKEQRGKDYFSDLVDHMTSGSTMFMVLTRDDAISGWRELIGPVDPAVAKEKMPHSLRASFGADILANAVHGSSDLNHVKQSAQLFFTDLDIDHLPPPAKEEEKHQTHKDTKEDPKSKEVEPGHKKEPQQHKDEHKDKGKKLGHKGEEHEDKGKEHGDTGEEHGHDGEEHDHKGEGHVDNGADENKPDSDAKEAETEEKNEEKTVVKDEEKTEEKNEEKTEEKDEEKTEEKTEEKDEEKTEEKTEEKDEEKTEEKTEEKDEEKTEEKDEEKTEEKVEEKTEEKAEENNEGSNKEPTGQEEQGEKEQNQEEIKPHTEEDKGEQGAVVEATS